MGKPVQKLATNVSLIASKNTWIEGLAIQQLIKTSELDGMQYVAGMPDLHPGRGYPVGAAFFATTKVYPALIGNDIGCGMAIWQSDTNVAKVNLDKLSKRFAQIELPLDLTWSVYISERKNNNNIGQDNFDSALGTIGGGNHFAEFQRIDEVYNQHALNQLGLETNKLQLLVHSGSRGLGQSILTRHIAEFNHAGLSIDSKDFTHYLNQHDEAVRWAELNRELIAIRFLNAIRSKGQCIFDVNHNLVTAKTIHNHTGWLHRKGATPSDKGCVVIPGSRGDYSYLVKPLVLNGHNTTINLYSLAHGAGRKWKRGDCQSRLSHKYKRDDMLRTSLGSRVICGNKTLLYDEAPQAYKDCGSVVTDLVDAGLVEIIARLKPLLTFKTNGDC